MLDMASIDLKITKGEWHEDEFHVQISHPDIDMDTLTVKALSIPGWTLFDAWEGIQGFTNLEVGDLRVSITNGGVGVYGGITREGDDALDGTCVPEDLSLTDMLMTAKIIRDLLI